MCSWVETSDIPWQTSCGRRISSVLGSNLNAVLIVLLCMLMYVRMEALFDFWHSVLNIRENVCVIFSQVDIYNAMAVSKCNSVQKIALSCNSAVSMRRDGRSMLAQN